MSGDVDGFVATIDSALDDWDVSGDAMRWAPDGVPDWREQVSLIVELANRFRPVLDGTRAVAEAIAAALRQMQEPIDELCRRIAAACIEMRAYHSWRDLPSRRRLPMRVKYADRNVPALAIDGRAYARRLRARRRRR